MTALVWFRRDLRVRDNPALSAALAGGDPAACLFVVEPAWLAVCGPRAAAFAEAVADLEQSLAAIGGRLILRTGPAPEAVADVARASGATRVIACADVTPRALDRDRATRRALEAAGIDLKLAPGLFVREPPTVVSSSGEPYKIFSSFYKRWRSAPVRDRWAAPPSIEQAGTAESDPDARAILDAADAAASTAGHAAGETAARRAMKRFAGGPISAFDGERHRVDGAGGSILSVALRTGAMSALHAATDAASQQGGEAWVRQLAWRDFASGTALRWPALLRRSLRGGPKQWSKDARALREWQAGTTGIAAVDAAMRQLAGEGWISHRARLLAGSVLVRDLRIDWREGARHFMRTLIDGDPAVNAFNWQWLAGTGYDAAAPDWRISPERQAERRDGSGEWLARWLRDDD